MESIREEEDDGEEKVEPKLFPISQMLRMYYRFQDRGIIKLLAPWLGPFDLEAPEFELLPVPIYAKSFELVALGIYLGASEELIKYHLDRIHDEQYRHR